LPQNPYSTSKLAMGQVALQLARRDNLKVIHVRPFNHFGPGQLEGYVVSDYAAQVARIEKGLIPPVIKVGDLSSSRDFTDVRDVVSAYALLLEKNLESGIYNVCSGIPREIKGILELLISYAKVKVAVEVDPERFRPSEVPIFVGSADKIKRATSWFVERSFEESILETLEWWRGMV
jgi:GDP-4-dehydro-6-deoxy-D-mannose reductase